MVTTAAPTITPGMLPMPPRMTMVSTPIDCMKEKTSGLTKVRLAANSTPITPANEAPQAKAASFILHQRDAHGNGGGLIFTDGDPGAADFRSRPGGGRPR